MTQKRDDDRLRAKTIYRVGLWLFLLWTLAAGGYALLLLNTQGGHPPASVFAPLMIPIWIVGSFILLSLCLFIAWLGKPTR